MDNSDKKELDKILRYLYKGKSEAWYKIYTDLGINKERADHLFSIGNAFDYLEIDHKGMREYPVDSHYVSITKQGIKFFALSSFSKDADEAIPEHFNVYISGSNGGFNLLDIDEEQLQIVVDTYLSGSSEFTLAGQHYKPKTFHVLKIFKNESAKGEDELVQLGRETGIHKGFNGRFFSVGDLKEFGKDVTADYIGNLAFGAKSKQVNWTTQEKLDKILEFLSHNKTRYNVALPTVIHDVFQGTLSKPEVSQLFSHVIDSGKVKVTNGQYIGWTLATEEFMENGGFSGLKASEARATIVEIPPSVFLSYSWKNEELAETIYKDISSAGLKCVKDNHVLDYKDSLSQFMESIRQSDYAILLISDYYLKSKNCMTEFGHLMKDQNHKQKILPILVPGTEIYNSESRLLYTHFWKGEFNNLKGHLRTLDIEDVIEEGKHLKVIRDISQNISDYLNTLNDMLIIPNSTLQRQHYKPLIEKISHYRK